MVNYFKALEAPKDQYLTVQRRISDKEYEIDFLPPEFFAKYKVLFDKIDSYDLLNDKNSKEKRIYTKDIKVEYDPDGFPCFMPDEITYSIFMSNFKNISLLSDYEGLSFYGILKILELQKEFEINYKGEDFYTDFMKYYYSIIGVLEFSDKNVIMGKNQIRNLLVDIYRFLDCQNRLSDEDRKLFFEAISYIDSLKIVVDRSKERNYHYMLPNTWYITQFNHLYNCDGKYAHKEEDLKRPIKDIFEYKKSFKNYGIWVDEANTILATGKISKMEWRNYTNFNFNVPIVREKYYYNMNRSNQINYNDFDGNIYSKNIINYVLGIVSAHAGLYKFFNYLKKYSSDYDKDLEFLKKYLFVDERKYGEILIRCCGFHKISSVADKVITTSCINYEEEFSEYIKRGWIIDFVKPIVLNPVNRRLEEYNDDFLLIRKMHKGYDEYVR